MGCIASQKGDSLPSTPKVERSWVQRVQILGTKGVLSPYTPPPRCKGVPFPPTNPQCLVQRFLGGDQRRRRRRKEEAAELRTSHQQRQLFASLPSILQDHRP